MSVRPDCPAAVLLVLDVMDEAEYGLEEQQNEDDDADNRMVTIEEVDRYGVHHPDTQPESDNVYDVCEELEDAVDEPYAAERAKSNENSANGEEDHES